MMRELRALREGQVQIREGQDQDRARLTALEKGRSHQTAGDEGVANPTMANDDEVTEAAEAEAGIESEDANVDSLGPEVAEVVGERY